MRTASICAGSTRSEPATRMHTRRGGPWCARTSAVTGDKHPPHVRGDTHKKRRAQRKRKKPKHRSARFWSPHDPDASFEHKGLGYHVEVTETCRNARMERRQNHRTLTPGFDIRRSS